MKVVIAPDSFKGSLSAGQAAEAMRVGLLRVLGNADVRLIPMADGGEGTLDALLSGGGERWPVRVRDAGGAFVEAAVGVLGDGSGIVEVARIVAITDPAGMETPVGQRSTLGVGDAIRLLLDRGVRRISVGLGGSSTNDAGAGMLVALGVRLLDRRGELVDPSPDHLGRVERVDVSGLDKRLQESAFLVLSDVQNPLTGEHGATATFGRQKGVQAEDVTVFDSNLQRFADRLEAALGFTAQDLLGSGAAGGLGFALRMLGAQMNSGGDAVADLLGLDEVLAGADWAITGEGKSDAQTLHGKTPFVVCRRALRHGVRTTLISGSIVDEGLEQHFAGCFALMQGGMKKKFAIAYAAELLANATERAARWWVAEQGLA